MSQTERVYRIEMLIKSRGSIGFRELQDELEVSRATLKRDLALLRDRLGAPIEYDRFVNGYRLAKGGRAPKHELPGLWFSERELYGLLMSHQLLGEIEGRDSTLGRHLQPLLDRIHALLGTSEAEARALLKRVKLIGLARRPVPGKVFELVGEALVKRRRVAMRYRSRRRGETSEREVSPQRLVHHRNTWYLDAWCHRSEALRRFALDAIDHAEALEQRAKDVPMRQVEQLLDEGYGIFAKADPTALRWATLLFEPLAARWVAHEQWHPQQQGRIADAEGRYELRLPYADSTELVMDILRHGEQVRVLEPPELAEQVRAALQRAAARYAAG
jgi:predicted DNA-binding transcriptional regulator YafY